MEPRQLARITPDLLLRAYEVGIFPMAGDRDGDMLYWLSPKQRGVFLLDSFHAPRRLARTLRKGGFAITIDQAFDDVLDACAECSPERPHTWINQEIRNLYLSLFGMGFAHSVEYRIDGKLMGGLYGVRIGAAFFGESMFSRADHASKIALVYLAARLKAGGFQFLDTQFITPHLRQFGATEVPRDRYVKMVKRATGASASFSRVDAGALETALQAYCRPEDASGTGGTRAAGKRGTGKRRALSSPPKTAPEKVSEEPAEQPTDDQS